MLATDGSEGASLALRAAGELAGGTGSELHLVHVVPTISERPYPYSWANHSWAKERREAQLECRRLKGFKLLDDQARRAEEEFGWTVTATHYREGKLVEEIVRLGKEIDAGLILTGGQRRPWLERMFDKGLSEKLFRRANCPVIVVGQRARWGTPIARNP